MRSAERRLAVAALVASALACGGGGGGGGGGSLPDTQRNVVPVSADGALCGANPGTYLNEPCVRVTVCTPGTQTCQAIDGILLDTGSFGLRIFKQALTVPLTPVTIAGRALAECMQFGDLSADWGPVETAGVVLGGEPQVQVPIQVIDATFPGRPTPCANAEPDPATAGFNGILGVGAAIQDCGGACTTSARVNVYYSCSGASCSGATVPLAQQVTNPVAALPQDNNGVVVKLPSVPARGAPSADGTLLLGIGTAADNVPGSVTVLDLDAQLEFRTTLAGGGQCPAFADTGSNALFFAPPGGVSLPTCASNTDWFCPPTTTALTATNRGASGHATATVPFQVANFDRLDRGNAVFSTLGGPALGAPGDCPEFDWGLPFFLGRAVYVGIEGTQSPLGVGPYVAH